MAYPPCSTCPHWDPRPETPPGYGVCRVLSSPPGVRSVLDEPSALGLIAYVDSDDRYQDAFLVTRPDFGCAAHPDAVLRSSLDGSVGADRQPRHQDA